MRPNRKSIENPEKPKFQTKKQARSLKPWVLEYRIVDEALFARNNWNSDIKKPDTWYKDTFFTYVSIEQALRELNKTARSYYGDKKQSIKEHWRFGGRELRILNQDTAEVILLTVSDSEILKSE